MSGKSGDLLKAALGDDHERRLERRSRAQLAQPVEALRRLPEQTAAGIELVQNTYRADIRSPQRSEHRAYRAEVDHVLCKGLGHSPVDLVVPQGLAFDIFDKIFDQAPEQFAD